MQGIEYTPLNNEIPREEFNPKMEERLAMGRIFMQTVYRTINLPVPSIHSIADLDNALENVKSDKSIYQIKELNLEKKELNYLPRVVIYLISLERLNLKDNNLKTLHPVIVRLNKLDFLDLSGNPIEELPDEFSQLTALKTLRIDQRSYGKVVKQIKSLKLHKLELTNLIHGFEEI